MNIWFQSTVAVFASLTLASCAIFKGKSYREQVHWDADQVVKGRKIVLFLDGTANDVDSRTNVRRLYEVVASQERPDILTYYDEGVGADHRPLTGGGAGYGFGRNMRQSYRFIAMNHRPGDKVYIFGFSRGAYNALALSGMIDRCGLVKSIMAPTWDREIAQLKQSQRSAERDQKIAILTKEKRDETERLTKKLYQEFKHNKTDSPEEFESRLKSFWGSGKATQRSIDIEVVGIWDTIEALGFGDTMVAMRKPETIEDHMRKGHQFHIVQPQGNINRLYHALSIDERRAYYFPFVLCKKGANAREFEQVWFAGDHSDVGGGRSHRKDLAGVSFNWMLDHIRRDGFVPSDYRVYENYAGRRHDLADSGFFKIFTKRKRIEAYEKNPNTAVHPSVRKRSTGRLPAAVAHPELEQGKHYDSPPKESPHPDSEVTTCREPAAHRKP